MAPGDEGAARAVAAKAEETCLVSVSLNVPVETSVVVRTVNQEETPQRPQ